MHNIQPLAASGQTAAGYYRSWRIFRVSNEISTPYSSCKSLYAAGEKGSQEQGPWKRYAPGQSPPTVRQGEVCLHPAIIPCEISN